MKFSLLSPNLVVVINKMLENQDIAKLVWYPDSNPLAQIPLPDGQSLIKTRVFPYMYKGNISDPQAQTQIRVYYGRAIINNFTVEETPVFFDILTHNDLILIDGTSSKLLRLYEIASRITQQFDGKNFNQIGKLQFISCTPVDGIPADYQMIRLIASMTTFSGM